MGARLRLNSTWYNANRGGLSAINGAIVDALRNYGVIVADLGENGLWIDATNDDRWDPTDLQAIRSIPVSAFEVLDTIHSQLVVSGPAGGLVGVPQTFTVQQVVPGNTNFSDSAYFYWSNDGGTTWNLFGHEVLDDADRGPLAISFTPPALGTYLVRTTSATLDWLEPDDRPFAVLVPASGFTCTGPSTASAGAPSSPFIVTPNGLLTGTITPSDGGAGGTFTPASLSWSAAFAAQSFTYTGSAPGTVTITMVTTPDSRRASR